MKAQEMTNSQFSARDFSHAGLHHLHLHCTMVQKVQGANLHLCTTPHHTPLGVRCRGAEGAALRCDAGGQTRTRTRNFLHAHAGRLAELNARKKLRVRGGAA